MLGNFTQTFSLEKSLLLHYFSFLKQKSLLFSTLIGIFPGVVFSESSLQIISQHFQKLFFPPTIREWNKLNCDIYNSIIFLSLNLLKFILPCAKILLILKESN